MSNEAKPKSGKDRINFTFVTRQSEYGDGKKFWAYVIRMWHKGRLAGTEDGPNRHSQQRESVITAAETRIKTLAGHRLFAIQVTKKHINDGEARNCSTCAISQALWHNQERMGFPKYDWSFRVSPYACFADADGITLERSHHSEPRQIIPDALWPDIVTPLLHKPGFYTESLIEWTMNWDDWADSRHMLLSEWREQHGYKDGERPSKPFPCSFVLDLDAFKTETNT